MKRRRPIDSGIAGVFTLILQSGPAPPKNAIDKTADFDTSRGVYRSLTLIGKDRARWPPAAFGKAYLRFLL
jgi:hypothetical protein